MLRVFKLLRALIERPQCDICEEPSWGSSLGKTPICRYCLGRIESPAAPVRHWSAKQANACDRGADVAGRIPETVSGDVVRRLERGAGVTLGAMP